MWEENRSKIVWWRSWGAPQEAFLAASVADRLEHTFLEASGVHFGSHFGLKKCFFWTSMLVPWVLILELMFNRFLLRVPSEI